MFTAVWCLFIFIGVWTTLRHTPFATWKSTLRTVGPIVLMLGLAAGVFVLTVQLVKGRSQTEKIRSGAYGGPQVTKVRKRVLIAPDTPATDLPALQAALIARCPNARIDLS